MWSSLTRMFFICFPFCHTSTLHRVPCCHPLLLPATRWDGYLTDGLTEENGKSPIPPFRIAHSAHWDYFYRINRSASRTRDVFLIYEEREEPSIDESVEKAAQRWDTFFPNRFPSSAQITSILSYKLTPFSTSTFTSAVLPVHDGSFDDRALTYFIWETRKWRQFVVVYPVLLLGNSLDLFFGDSLVPVALSKLFPPLFFSSGPSAPARRRVPVRLSFNQPQLPPELHCFAIHRRNYKRQFLFVSFSNPSSSSSSSPPFPVIWVILPSSLTQCTHARMHACTLTPSKYSPLGSSSPPPPNFSLVWLSLVSFPSSGMLRAHVSVNRLDLNSNSLSFTG